MKSGKKHRTKMVVQAPFVLQSKMKLRAMQLICTPNRCCFAMRLMRANLRPRTSQRQAVGGAKGCQFIEGEACKGNKFALALTERLRQHPAPPLPNRVRAKGAQRIRKYDRCRKLPTSTIRSQTRSMQFPFCTGQRLKEKHNFPHLYKPDARREAGTCIFVQTKISKRSGSFRHRPAPGENPKRGARPLFGRFKGKGFSREGGNRNPPSLERVLWLLSARAESDPGSGAG